MRWKAPHSHLKFVGPLIMACIVTACVKNNGKNPGTVIEESRTLEKLELQSQHLDGEEDLKFATKETVPARSIHQTYQFSSSEIRDLRLLRGPLKSNQCESLQQKVISSLTLVDSRGGEYDLNGAKQVQILPGDYSIHLVIDNAGLCRDIAMDIKVDSPIREDLVLTPQRVMGLGCGLVEKNGDVQTQFEVKLNSYPLNLVAIQRNDISKTQTVFDLSTDNKLCNVELSANETCLESLTPVEKEANPVYASQKSCFYEKQPKRKNHATLQLFDRAGEVEGQFKCDKAEKAFHLNMKECEVDYDFGSSLFSISKQTNITIDENLIRLEFEFNEDIVDLESLPQRLQIGLYRWTKEGQFESFSAVSRSLSVNPILNGQVVIAEPSIRQRVQEFGLENIFIVFAKDVNLKQGLFHLNLKRACLEKNSHLLQREGEKTVNLCE